jgi:hypothetical protein
MVNEDFLQAKERCLLRIGELLIDVIQHGPDPPVPPTPPPPPWFNVFHCAKVMQILADFETDLENIKEKIPRG